MPTLGQPSSLGGDCRLAVGGLILVDDALGDRLVEGTRGLLRQLGGLGSIAGVRSLAEPADRGAQRRLGRPIALTSLLVRFDPLELGLDIRHGMQPSGRFFGVKFRVDCAADATAQATSGAWARPNS